MKLTLKKEKLTADDLRLKAAGAHHFEVLNHYSWSKYTAVYFNYDGDVMNHLHSNTIADLNQHLIDWFGTEKKRFLIHVYSRDSKLVYISPEGKATLIKQ